MESKEMINVSLNADGSISAKRRFEIGRDSIDLALHFTSTTPLTLEQVHVATIQIAIQHLQTMLEKAKAAANPPTKP